MEKRRLTSVSPLSAFVHGALVSFLLAYPLVALMRFFQHFDGPVEGPWWAIWLLFPAGFAIFGAVWAMLASLAYNSVARLLGGVVYTSAEKQP
ncbi:hypothetical protein PHO31112_03235 [Pandoraea horticolens]|uniref:Transmembrane protein n=1 Tax=Pandoraea horticolens TaxID=2508298 RepID=A0A5E4WHK0_9BURK|nr:hypothetical protein [Pandoraea horticolens]VVE23074.1 hypothetical protein PHO31112_03235 [Pandoraea horticolens]